MIEGTFENGDLWAGEQYEEEGRWWYRATDKDGREYDTLEMPMQQATDWKIGDRVEHEWKRHGKELGTVLSIDSSGRVLGVEFDTEKDYYFLHVNKLRKIEAE